MSIDRTAVVDEPEVRRSVAIRLVPYIQSVARHVSDRATIALFMAPSIVLIAAVFLIPIIVSFVVSLFAQASSSELIPTAFVGIENYTLLIEDDAFVATVGRTLVFTGATVAAEVIVGFAMALVLNVNLPVMRIVRTILIVPMMMTPIVAALMWKLGLAVNHGFVGKILPLDIVWLGNSFTAFLSLIVASTWQSAPYVALILLAGLRTLPGELLDAATIDGANRWQRIRHVVIPVMMPHILLTILLRTIFEFRSFEKVYIMTGGGPGSSTMLLSLYTYRTSFVSYDLGLSAAAAWLTLFLTLGVCGSIMLSIRLRSRLNAA